MPTNILMPALSPTMETGTLAKWYVKEGDRISSGELLAEIETDKATMEFEAIDDGVITKIFVEEGTAEIAVNSVIAEIASEDDQKVSTTQVTQEIKSQFEKTNLEKHEIQPLAGKDDLKTNKLKKSKRVKISPLAKKIALKNNLNVDQIPGSGPQGRIIRNDVMLFLETTKNFDSQTFEPTKNNLESLPVKKDIEENSTQSVLDMFSKQEYDLIPISNMRKIVANRLSFAKKTIPHFYLERSIQSDKLIKLRTELNESFDDKKIKFSINDFIIKAAARSLQDNPKCNAIWTEENILQLKNSDISVAVAINEGLITPVIFQAEKKSLQEISLEMRDKATRARAKKLLPEEYIGGSFSISNLGMLGIENFAAVINPPQASILAVGSSEKKTSG